MVGVRAWVASKTNGVTLKAEGVNAQAEAVVVEVVAADLATPGPLASCEPRPGLLTQAASSPQPCQT